MTLPIPNLDDRRFDDLVAELTERLRRQMPEFSQLAPGDPAHVLVDLFAWLSETVIYRANRIPERQRVAFLNLLQIPRRAARPARGLVCLDALGAAPLPNLLPSASELKGGQVSFITEGELQPTPLVLRVLIKQTLSNEKLAAEGITLEQLRTQFGSQDVRPFRPVSLLAGDVLSTEGTLDDALYLGLCAPRNLVDAAAQQALRDALGGIVLNLGLAPEREIPASAMVSATDFRARELQWDLAWWPPAAEYADVRYLPLSVIDDSSRGGRTAGVVRLRLPVADFLEALLPDDPRYIGTGDTPPEAPSEVLPGQLLFWLRLRARDGAPLRLGYLGVNAVNVVGQGLASVLVLGVGDGQPDQQAPLPHADVDEDSVEIEVQSGTRYEGWTRVPHFMGSGPDDGVFVVDAAARQIRFGDGIRGKRPPLGMNIRARRYRFGGGSAGNLPAGAIKTLAKSDASLKVRHEWPTDGGVDAESIDAAQRRIPAFLAHRERAITAEDFELLARDNPMRPMVRADARPGFFPGASLSAARRDVPGVVSVFMLPEAAPAMAAAPRCGATDLRDVFDYLRARTLLGTELYVLTPQYQPLAIALALEVIDADQTLEVMEAAQRALLHYLWPLPPFGPRARGWPLGRSVEINELRTQAGRVAGVEAVNDLRLFFQDLNTGQWRELTGALALPLMDYQLPELMHVSVQPGESRPEPPVAFSPGTKASGPKGAPVPVIPPTC